MLGEKSNEIQNETVEIASALTSQSGGIIVRRR